jgi:hypothetical protein
MVLTRLRIGTKILALRQTFATAVVVQSQIALGKQATSGYQWD